MKRTITLLLLIGIALPFILLTDLYPFFRFGMFAEPVVRQVQTEKFLIAYLDGEGNRHFIQPGDLGLSGLDYLLRNYYYRNETSILLQRIRKMHPNPAHRYQWQLLRVTSPVNRFVPDTTVVGKLPAESKK